MSLYLSPLANSLSYSITCSLTHLPSQSLTSTVIITPGVPSSHSLTHSLTHLAQHEDRGVDSPTLAHADRARVAGHSFTHSLIQPLTHPLTHSLTHSLTHPLTHTLPSTKIEVLIAPLSRMRIAPVLPVTLGVRDCGYSHPVTTITTMPLLEGVSDTTQAKCKKFCEQKWHQVLPQNYS